MSTKKHPLDPRPGTALHKGGYATYGSIGTPGRTIRHIAAD
jgi:hypothetical protein